MSAKKYFLLFILLLLAASACKSGSLEDSSSPQEFSASATTGVSVQLAWPAVAEATGYLIEASYGGEYFPVADLGGETTAFIHFVVPGAASISYRVFALVGSVPQEIGASTATIPELAPNPLLLSQIVPFAPIVGEMPLDFSQFPTLDPQNPDPNVMATLAAFTANIDPNNLDALIPDITLVSITQEIGPEGGSASLTDPNGVLYTLQIPPGLLEEPTTFTLDPIESIPNLPFSGLLGALDIFPPIPFNVPLPLSITLPEGASSGETVVAFIGSSLNYELSLAPVYQDGTSYTANVYWGDVIGIATASREEVLAQAARIPSDAAEQISQQIAVMQALSGDSSPEGIDKIFLEILEGLLQQSEIRSEWRGTVGRLAAPLIQSRTGIELWTEISRASRVSSDTQASQRSQDAYLATELGNPAGRGQLISNLVSKIKQFLDTHTGCRTRDELYAQAILDLLYLPSPGFEQNLADNFITRYGVPERLMKCTFQLHIPQSTIVINVTTADGGAATETTKVHVDPMPLFVSGRGTDIHLYSIEGYGQVVYETFEFLVKDCPPAIKPRAPSNAAIYITNLSPTFDEDLRVDGFKLRGIRTDLGITSPNLGRVRTDTSAGVCKVTGYTATAEAPNKWGIAMVVLHGPFGGSDNWVIAGEDSYVATNTISNYSKGGLTENATMILTVNKEEGDGGTQ